MPITPVARTAIMTCNSCARADALGFTGAQLFDVLGANPELDAAHHAAAAGGAVQQQHDPASVSGYVAAAA